MTSASISLEAIEVVTSGGEERANERHRLRLPAWSGLALAVGLAVFGFGLIAFTWWKVSDLTNLAQQMPYFVSGGLTGTGLVVLAAAVLVVVTRQADDQEREARAQALVDALRALAEKDEK